MNDKASGFFDFEENTIYTNETGSPYRQTFTVAHGLGHKVLRENYFQSGDYNCNGCYLAAFIQPEHNDIWTKQGERSLSFTIACLTFFWEKQ